VATVWHGWVVTETLGAARRSTLRAVRRVIGIGLLIVVVVAGVLFILGAWNPWRLVFLEYRFGNPMLGLMVVPIGALIGLWLGMPVRNETRQRGRIAARVVALVLAVAGVIGWGVFGPHFAYDVEEQVSSGDGDRTVAIVSDRDTPPNSYLRVWEGAGLIAREVGDIGRVCGSVSVRFVTNDQIELDTNYGDWLVDLDPETGAPLQVLGPVCDEGPVPATLGP
jgi:hypothetical protein